MSTPKKVIDLINRFDSNIDAYRSGNYKEIMLRKEFIDPFFKVLSWDVDNEQGIAEAYKDVIHEDSIKVGGSTKAPDYCFRIGATRKFFLEAKKPAVDIAEDIHPAYQLRRYAWSAKLPLSILTDFEEFAVYDCRIKPLKADKASTARIMYLTYKEYEDRWEEITEIFSRDAVWKGSFDKYVESTKRKRGTAEVDSAFLTEIESWREIIARNIALRNPGLTQHEMNFAVQRTIDRIIFLRICEDRGIEDYGLLMALQNGTNIYTRLTNHFRRADEKYNSGLFHFHEEKGRPEPPDELTLNLNIDDKVLKEIFKDLYYPESPYEFSVLPADILGHIYEQFLGKVIRLTPGHRAKVEEKPEVRKAGGVYYTPTYIVDYIVKNTVGKLAVNKTPKQVAKLKILDPACGSGSFLIGAYQYLLDWHRCWYENNGEEKWAKGRSPKLFRVSSGDPSSPEQRQAGWRLTTEERKRILLNNIYGVDIDSQAVEVTKLSLLLKVLEGESGETINRQRKLFHERALPDLGNNIKCGNSLIGPDFYEGEQISLLDEEERYRINAFDWEAEFPEVFKHQETKDIKESKRVLDRRLPFVTKVQTGSDSVDGFDAVIGNPPYGGTLSSAEQNYINNIFRTSQYQLDTYPLFIEKSYIILKRNGYCGLIVPTAWVASKYDETLRKFLILNTTLQNIAIAPRKVFQDATVETLIIVFKNRPLSKDTSFEVYRWDKKTQENYRYNQSKVLKSEATILPVYVNPNELRIIEKLSSSKRNVSQIMIAVWGVKVYQKGKGIPKQSGIESQTKIFHSSTSTKKSHKPLLGGREISRYNYKWKGIYIDYGKWLAEPRTPEWFDGPRILIREVTSKGVIQATIIKDEFVFSNSVDCLKLDKGQFRLEFLLGLINSTLYSFFHLRTSANAFKESFPKVLIKDLLNFPIPDVELSNSDDKSRHDKMVKSVEHMLELNKQLAKAKAPHDREVIQRQIDTTDRQIDQLVYELYDLTENEIGIIEESINV